MTLATRLETGASFPLDANGNCTIRLSPNGEKWEILRMWVGCNDRSKEAQCRVYRGMVAPGNVVDGTYAGSSGDTSDTSHYLEDGSALFIEWTGGVPGATATVTVSGWRSTPDGGFRAVH